MFGLRTLQLIIQDDVWIPNEDFPLPKIHGNHVPEISLKFLDENK